MSDERSSSSPAPAGGSVPPAAVPGQSSPSNPVSNGPPEPLRLPSIPGLVPPRIPGRAPLDSANLRSTQPSAEPQGLMRPHLPIRKPIPLPGADAPDATTISNEDSSDDESKIFSGAPILPNATPRRLVPPPKPPMAAGPTAAANSSGTGLAPRRRATPAPHNVATITAMRIISIGVEDRPPPSEFTARPHGSAPDLDIQLYREEEEPSFPRAPTFDPDTDRAPARSFTESLPSFDGQNAGTEARTAHLEALPAFELSEPIESPEQSAMAPLPAFDMPESESAEPEEAEPEEAEPEEAEDEAATAQLPAFEMPEPDLQPQESAIAPLPEFEILKPVDAPQDLELVPLATAPQLEQDFEDEQPPPLPVHAPLEPVELEEDDVAPDSGPPELPSRLESLPKLEPPAPPSRAVSAPIAAPPPPLHSEVAPPVSEANEAVGPATKRNPPPPPRRSFPAPGEVLSGAASSEPSQPVAVAVAPASQESKSDEKAASRARRPWWEELFNEDYSRALSRLSDEQIKREASFIEESLGVAQGGVLLDLGCGPGYHAVELAERGYAVVGYDLSLHQLALAADVAQERQQKLNLMQGDMREMAFDGVFDGIYCWNTTFGYFEEEKNLAVAENIFKALKPGGTFLVDVINRDFVAMQQPSSVWFEGDSAVCMDDMTVDFISSRLRVKRSVMLDDGRTRECAYSIRLYSLHELGKLLHDVGFRVAEASGDPSMPGVFMGQNAPRIIILAQRP